MNQWEYRSQEFRVESNPDSFRRRQELERKLAVSVSSFATEMLPILEGLGGEGWELIQVISVEVTDRMHRWEMVFKRPISQ